MRSPRRRRVLGWIWRITKVSAAGLFCLALIPVALVAGLNVWCATGRDVAYRNQHPSSLACQDQRRSADLLAGEDYVDVVEGHVIKTGEQKAAAENDRIETVLACAVQEHVIPARPGDTWPNGKLVADLRYHLGFVEFKENGEPYSLVGQDEVGVGQLPRTQAEALRDHFARQIAAHKSNYVIAFVHGWRHDAHVGDSDVADLRIYAGHVAAFLAERCIVTKQYCDTTVTAVYVGWRGAVIREKWLRDRLGSTIGGMIARVAAVPTFFSRRRVSEQISPGVVSLLQTISTDIGLDPAHANEDTKSRMIVLAHSLGGHLLIVGLKQSILDSIQKLPPSQELRPPIGNLIVLLNPASEAENWTALQRAVRARKSSLGGEGEQCCSNGDARSVFPPDQPPVLVSITSARTWPAGGLRNDDCKQFQKSRARYSRLSRLIQNHRGNFVASIRYDWATHDLFPAIRGDLRPVAQALDRLGFDFEGKGELGHDCLTHHEPHFSLVGSALHVLAGVLRAVPFDADLERTRTIGHLVPQRPAFAFLTDDAESPFPFGTTHEMEFEWPDGTKRPDFGHRASYRDISNPEHSDCAAVTGWLVEARERRKRTNESGEEWDSNDRREGPALTPVQSVLFKQSPFLSSEFRHGLMNSGTRPISEANDPFWNVRALATAVSGHGGYVTTPLICALNQLVLDDIVARPGGW
jgi:hypothetical protein